MLNPPLSLLSDDLFACIVDHVAELPFPNKHLYNLSIADRAFTRFCQRHIFKVLQLEDNHFREDSISSRLEKMRKTLDENPSFANSVRVVAISSGEAAWLFNDPTFISILQLVAESLMPPHKLRLFGHSATARHSFRFDHPILIVGRLMDTFFSQSLTVLHLMLCMDVPFTVFLICPRLREVLLNNVRASMESYDEYPEEQCSGRAFPTLDSLDYRRSGSLVEQMITPPPRFHTAVSVLWSKLRVLTLSPYDNEDTAYFQPILDVACNTLEKLYLTNLPIMFGMLPVRIGHVNLRNLSCLHVLAFYIMCDSDTSGVLCDINLVLNTIPSSNQVTNLTLKFDVFDLSIFRGCPDEDWVGLCNHLIRISGGQHLTLTFDVVLRGYSRQPYLGEELCESIKDKIISLSEYPNICTVVPRCRFLAPWDQGS